MYISVEESLQLDKVVKANEVAMRSFVADVLRREYRNQDDFKIALQSISISNELIYARRFSAKLRGFISKSADLYRLIQKCTYSLDNGSFDNDVPYVSELIDLLLIFFNKHFSEEDISKSFSSIEEFHYCCTLYHQIRNNLSHPASRPITIADANKISYFIENVTQSLDEKYFWYRSKQTIAADVDKFKKINTGGEPKFHNLLYAVSSHKSLLCRDSIIDSLYECILGNDVRQRLAGSVVLYGYGGVGKTAITTEFLYRLLRDKRDGLYLDIDYLLFFSSKDEYLRENNTTGELYIDTAKPEYSTLEELQNLISNSLNIDNISELSQLEGRGIIAIDNFENIDVEEKNKIMHFIKSLPRSVQFIVTSRNEESCEEKIHVEEFKDDEIGLSFVEEIVETEEFNVDVKNGRAKGVLKASKGNALIIVQVLNIINRGVSSYEEITSSLDSMKSKNSEMIASFMYKNTFDDALRYLADSGYPINTIMQVISLYDENIELYSISKLAKIDVSDAERACNYLLERLILRKSGEYYSLNEFAKRFVFIKLIPDRFELSNLRDKIKNHKERMKKKISELDGTLDKNSILHQNVTEWQPRNYIDKIVIAELFSLYGEAIKCVSFKNIAGYEKYLKEFDDHSFITNHPFVPLQKARLLKEGARKLYPHDKSILLQVEQLYEEALESIEYDYRYLIGGAAHASLLMFFGIHLFAHLNQEGRAIRFLEEAKKYHGNNGNNKNKAWFITCNYLSQAYLKKYKDTNDRVYSQQLRKIIREVFESHNNKSGFDIDRYKSFFSKWIS